ncbi:hypothetical protein V5735_18670 (plasmid) [Haladaptatus sp. SPP-AMP-3]|uniref:hypothetical protein n=1 Tax=Haladaptatus sp. SPP-AMP-3 TaxID=3121295 RepID=UPI003C2DA3FC
MSNRETRARQAFSPREKHGRPSGAVVAGDVRDVDGTETDERRRDVSRVSHGRRRGEKQTTVGSAGRNAGGEIPARG